jgi:ADP-heptose:LPS heptosyltransferase
VFTTGETFGDAVYKVVFLRGLRAIFPGAQITWLTTGSTLYAGDLAPAAAPLLDRVVERCGLGETPRELLRPVPRIGRFDLLIDTQAQIWRTLSVWRVPHRRFLSMTTHRRGVTGPHVLDRLFGLVEWATGQSVPRDLSPIPLPEPLRRAAAEVLPGPRAGYVAFAPGAGGVQKIWPLDRFLSVAQGVVTAGRVPVFFLGPAEVGWRDRIAGVVPKAVFPLEHPGLGAVGGPKPLATVALAARCAAAIANDSGTGHMIAASGTPLLSLFGPSDAQKFRPVARRGTVLRAQDFGGPEMRHIPVEAAAAALDALLADISSPAG